jgi:tight adherence protein B
LVIITMVMVFASIVLAFQGMFLWVAMRREAEDERLRHRLGLRTHAEEEADAAQEEADAVSDIIREEGVDTALAFLGEYGERMHLVIRASNSELTVTKLFTNMVLTGVGVSAALFFLVGPPAIFAIPIGMYVPYGILKGKADQRASSLLSQMPDALEMMSRAMQTGTGLSETFRLASEEMPEPLNMEFGRVYEEVRFGKDWRIVMDALVDRNPTIFDLRLFVSTLLLQRDTGGNMIETLSNIAKTIRGRYVFDAKVRAMTSEARTAGFVLAGMPLAVIGMIIFASPDYLTPLYTTTIGQMFILLCMCMYGFGLYMMQITAQVEV